MSIQKRGSIYYLRRRVPERFRDVEERSIVWVSLKTDSETAAKTKAPAVWEHLLDGWEARLAGASQDAERRFEAARDLAETRGYRYLPAEKVSMLQIDELLDRVDATVAVNGSPDPIEATALLGGAGEAPITVSRALELYWSYTADELRGKSDDQIRRWKNPRMRAVNNFIKVVGDKPLQEISGDDMLDFRAWWQERMTTNRLTPNSANKDLTHLGGVLKKVNQLKRLNLDLPLSGLQFKNAEAKQRPAFSSKWIRERVLADGALQSLNPEARAILLGMINTGYRPSEGAALPAAHIHLDCEYPHISIAPTEERQLKTSSSRRVVPLVGVSLEAFRAFPEGFPRYQQSSASLSATVNKFLKARGLLETPDHSLYGLRHSFEDRLLDADVDERIRRDLMGHSLTRERYGEGASLAKLHGIVARIAL